MDEVPIACTLDATQLEQRQLDIADVARDGLISADREERRVALRFNGDAGLRRRVAEIAAAESRCCAFLSFALDDEAGAFVLRITAPPGGETLLDQLADAFTGPPPGPAARSSPG